MGADPKATSLVTKAIKNGALVRPDECDECHVYPVRPHAHHDDYTKPLDVRWLCLSCHRQFHEQLKKANTPLPGQLNTAGRTRPNWLISKSLIQLVAITAAANRQRPEQLVEETLRFYLDRIAEALKNAID